MSGASGFIQQNDILGVIDTNDNNDNVFGNKTTFNLEPTAANFDNEAYKMQMDAFDEELSQLIVEEAQNREAMNAMMDNIMINNMIANSVTPPVVPFEFVEKVTPICPIVFE